jgi:mevalonate pyrophosphate decarboxylase
MKHVLVFLAGVVLLYAFSATPRTAVEAGPVAKALQSASSSDRAKVAAIYRALADVTSRDKGQQISTTAVWRSVHGAALRLSVGGTELVGKYKGLDLAAEAVLAKHFSLDNVALTTEINGKPVWQAIVDGCRDVEAESGR